jgi:hypothetical protein
MNGNKKRKEESGGRRRYERNDSQLISAGLSTSELLYCTIIYNIAHCNILHYTTQCYVAPHYTTPHYAIVVSNMAQAVRLLICIWDISGSILCRDTDYSNRGISWYSSDYSGKYRCSVCAQATTTSFHIISDSLNTYYPIIRRYVIWFTDWLAN